jgi:hypothetical protein
VKSSDPLFTRGGDELRETFDLGRRGLRNVSGNGLLGMLPSLPITSHHTQIIRGASERLLIVSERTR